MGTSAFFYAGGPGMDPHYDPSAKESKQESEAYTWGHDEGEEAAELAATHSYIDTYIIFIDVEDSSMTPTGWNEEMYPGSCTDVLSSTLCCATAVDRATFNGFWDYIWDDSNYAIAAYASPGTWFGIFGSDGSLSDTTEWTAGYASGDGTDGCGNPAPTDWTQDAGDCSSNSASFFGGIDSSDNCALEWQWAGVGLGDFDQIDTNRTGLCE